MKGGWAKARNAPCPRVLKTRTNSRGHASLCPPYGRSRERIAGGSGAGAHVAGANGAEQVANAVEGAVDQAGRLAGVHLVFEFEEHGIGAVEAARQQDGDVK